ncbi:MAG: FAD-binding oxidoreductase, partial [Acidobacteriota bacterium]|nr:FAD-binding oxidoreductase [Acidobacteriota bacterium]
MRALIIGAGVIGCSVAFQLQRRGWDVVVLDKNGDAGHGSTSSSCGIVRRFYSQPGMIAMAHESASIWADWQNFLGPIDDDLARFIRPGMMFIPPKIDESVHQTIAAMKRVGVAVELLSPDDIGARFPFLATQSNHPAKPTDDDRFFDETGRRLEGAVFEEDAGYVVSPGVATLNLRMAGEREGVRFVLNTEVTAIERTSEGAFSVTSSDGKR